MLERLHQRGMLKRASKPPPDLLMELFANALPRLECSQCQRPGLQLQEIDEQGWDTGRSCQSCGKRIPVERLEVLPETQYCTACAAVPADGPEGEYCPKCGALMSIRPSRRGLTRYELSCPDCR